HLATLAGTWLTGWLWSEGKYTGAQVSEHDLVHRLLEVLIGQLKEVAHESWVVSSNNGIGVVGREDGGIERSRLQSLPETVEIREGNRSLCGSPLRDASWQKRRVGGRSCCRLCRARDNSSKRG